jgi:type II secretory pathway pseudopilin PulG
MPQAKHNRGLRRLVRWHALLSVLVIAALSVSLATRFCRSSDTVKVHVQANASNSSLRQHMDRDATQWVAPVTRLIFLETVEFYPRFAPTGPPLPALLFDQSLYNRPPPSLSNLA